ncbi:MAG: class I SAM-dependent methyltransferase [Anaerolineae bacterium]
MKQETIVKACRMWARIYDWSVPFYLLGQESRTRREAVAGLDLHASDTVLDLACGTGSNFPYLQQAVGSSGHIIGLDYTPAMLAEARKRVARARWDNVTLIRGDAAQLRLNPIARLMGWGAAADMSRRPWEEMRRYLVDMEFQEFFLGGFFYVTWGKKPN